MGGSKYFTTLDLRAGYWNVPMSEQDHKEKSAFICRQGLFQWEVMPFGYALWFVMPFGLLNAPAIFQR